MELQEQLLMSQLAEESSNRYLTFFTDRQLFGLPITEIVQIAQMQDIISLPEQASYVKGLINLRGQIIPVIDIRKRFGKKSAEFTERTCIIIAHMHENDFGLIVDEVDGVTDIETQQISAPPKIGNAPSHINDYLMGIATLQASETQKERVIFLLHAGKILGESEFAELSKAGESLDAADKNLA